MLEISAAILVLFLVGAVGGGFVTGLTGFGTALVVSAFWLHFLDPIVVAPLAAVASVAGQFSSLKGTWRQIQWRAVTPFLIGAGIGLPLGSWLLQFVDADRMKLGVGLFLIVYCSYFLIVRNPPRIPVDNRAADGAVGVLGGVMGGMAALSGPAPLIWCQLRGLPKTMQRGIYQPYNMIVLGVAAGLHGLHGRLTPEIGIAFLVALPATFVGARAGVALYHRLDDKLFQRIVLSLLLVSGFVLTVRTVF